MGATGVLRPAVEALSRRGDEVLAVARRPAPLAELAAATGAAVLAVDLSRPDLAPEVVPAADAALVYRPAVGDPALQLLTRRIRDRGVLVVTSAAADPALAGADFDLRALPPAPAAAWRRLVLGWAHDGPVTRWHTPEEISAAAVRVLDSGREEVLGAVRPWQRRP